MSLCSTSLRVLTILVLGSFLFGEETVQAQSTRTMTDTIAVDPDAEVEIHAVRGHVEVTTWDRPAVRLHGEIEEAASTSDETSEIQVTREDSTLTITPNGKTMDLDIFTVLGSMVWLRGEPEGPTTIYSVRVPTDASVVLKLDAADVKVNGVEGDVRVEGVSSSVDVRNVGGEVAVATLSGSIYAENVRGKLGMGTAYGDLQARLSTPTNKLHVGSYTGDAQITLPADAAFDLKTDITWGSVTSDFAIPDSAAQDDGSVPIGDGGPTVVFESFSGNLMLRAE